MTLSDSIPEQDSGAILVGRDCWVWDEDAKEAKVRAILKFDNGPADCRTKLAFLAASGISTPAPSNSATRTTITQVTRRNPK